MGCENEHGWRFITACIALRAHLPDEAARAKAAEDVVALWEAHEDGDEAVSRYLDARKPAHEIHSHVTETDERMRFYTPESEQTG